VSGFEPHDLDPQAHATGSGTPGRMTQIERPEAQVASGQGEPLSRTGSSMKGWLLVAGVALVFGLGYLAQLRMDAVGQAKADAATKAASDAAAAIAADDAAPHKWWAEASDYQSCIVVGSPGGQITDARQSGETPEVTDHRDSRGYMVSVDVSVSAGTEIETTTYYRDPTTCGNALAALSHTPDRYR
jgi:hypothetical protein